MVPKIWIEYQPEGDSKQAGHSLDSERAGMAGKSVEFQGCIEDMGRGFDPKEWEEAQ